jgi:hypothetical protein
MQEHDDRALNRRRLLRRAGTVAAGVAGAGVVGAATASPAQADSHPLVLGTSNTEDAQTTLTNTTGSAEQNALRLQNGTGAALSLQPLTTDPGSGAIQPPSAAAPVGSLYADDWGDFYGVGQPSGTGQKFITPLYSPNWATMVIPTSPFRFLDSRFAQGRIFVEPGSASFDGAGRVLPRRTNDPDLVLDLSSIFAGGFGAVQATLTAVIPAVAGFGSLWPSGAWPGTSSINFHPALPAIATFTQTVIGTDRKIRLKTEHPAAFIVDIVGFVLTDPFTQFTDAAANGQVQSAAGKAVPALWQKRRPQGR